MQAGSGVRECSDCKRTLPLTVEFFYEVGGRFRRYRCRECTRKVQRRYAASEHGRETKKRYASSEIAREREKLRAKTKARRELQKRLNKRWRSSEAGRESQKRAYKRWASTENGRETIRNHIRKRRAIRRGVQAELVRSADVFERDGWRCQLCKKPVNRGARFPHPLSASIDHIVPLASGGTHEMRNVQCAHLRCNSKKYSRTVGQLRLA